MRRNSVRELHMRRREARDLARRNVDPRRRHREGAVIRECERPRVNPLTLVIFSVALDLFLAGLGTGTGRWRRVAVRVGRIPDTNLCEKLSVPAAVLDHPL